VLLSRAWDVVYIRPHPNPHSSSRMSITEEQQAALRFIAAAPRGVSLSTMMARGFSFEMLQGLVHAGLATMQRDVINAGNERVAYLRITGAGRTAIVE
jgi:hypothetical protein